jgi:hypothetical protein
MPKNISLAAKMLLPQAMAGLTAKKWLKKLH